MAEQKKPRGRPEGSRYPRSFTVYLSDRGMEQLAAVAQAWETTNAEAIRRLIREKAQELGLAEGAE